mgnify:CR=1 FL=1
MKHPFLSLLFVGGLLAGCTGTGPNDNMLPGKTDSTQAHVKDNDWRTGDSVVAQMGCIGGKLVSDMFAGDGYYTWKLLDAGARVIAIDDNPANIAALEARKKQSGIGDDRLIIRATTPGNPGLLPNEVDMALITREYSTLGDRGSWFKQLRAGIKPPSTFYMVNFLAGETRYGPPLNQRMDYYKVSDELNEFGFTDVGVKYKGIPYRYLLFASVVQEVPEDH